MSVQAIGAALAVKGVSSTEKLLLIVLANYADENGRCWPSNKRLCDDASLSERTIRATLKALDERGIISRTERFRADGSRTSDVITLVPQSTEIAGGGAEFAGGVGQTPPGGGARIAPLTTFEPSKNRQSEPKAGDELFEIAWKAYPHVKGRSSKPLSLAQWKKIGRGPALVSAVNRYRREGREPKQECGAPAFERWLRKEQYLDWMTEPTQAPAKPVSAEVLADRLQHYRDTTEWKSAWGPFPGSVSSAPALALVSGGAG